LNLTPGIGAKLQAAVMATPVLFAGIGLPMNWRLGPSRTISPALASSRSILVTT
jgi:hypothetical protein